MDGIFKVVSFLKDTQSEGVILWIIGLADNTSVLVGLFDDTTNDVFSIIQTEKVPPNFRTRYNCKDMWAIIRGNGKTIELYFNSMEDYEVFHK